MKMLVAALAAMVCALPIGASADDNDLLARVAAVNPGLHSYTATMKAHVALTTFPFLSTDITANVYHKDPDRNKVEITSGLPMVASQFGKLYPHIEPPARWATAFVVSKVGDDGTHTTFKLVPRVSGNVDHLDAVVDDKAATVSTMRWTYVNGGTAEMNSTYGLVQGQMMVTSQTGTVEEPNYQGTITATLSDYKINPPLDDSIFNGS
jgi:outer membrane lipoprotein-sorting protein